MSDSVLFRVAYMSSEANRHSDRFLGSNSELFEEAKERDSLLPETPTLDAKANISSYGNAFLITELAKSVGTFQALVDEVNANSENQQEVTFHAEELLDYLKRLYEEVFLIL